MNMKLTIDDVHVGYVKRYYRTDTCWVFVLDTIASASDNYDVQVVVPMHNIKLFTSANGLEIILKPESYMDMSERLIVVESGEDISIEEFKSEFEKAKRSGIVLGDWESNLEYSIKHGILKRIN